MACLLTSGPPLVHVNMHFREMDNGPEFIVQTVRDWIGAVGAKTAYIELGSPWENGYCESFNARLREELLNGEVFYSLRDAQILIENGGNTTTPSDHTVRWVTVLQPQNPSSRWNPGQSCANIQNRPLKWG